MNDIAVLVVCNNPIIRIGLRSALSFNNVIKIEDEITDALAAIDWITSSSVDVVLLDVHANDVIDLGAFEEISRVKTKTKTVIITTLEDPESIIRAVTFGAKGYIIYNRVEPEDLITTIERVSDGETVIDSEAATNILIDLVGHRQPRRFKSNNDPIRHLTRREEQILKLISEGKANHEIAGILDVEEKTVKNHINNLYTKLHIKSRYEAILLMMKRSQ